jgi:hypothetical protein
MGFARLGNAGSLRRDPKSGNRVRIKRSLWPRWGVTWKILDKKIAEDRLLSCANGTNLRMPERMRE